MIGTVSFALALAVQAPTAQPTSVQPAPVQPAPAPVVAPAQPVQPAPVASSEVEGPPYYTERDMATLRQRYQLGEPETEAKRVRWRCLIADPSCGFGVEINATSAYAYRLRQGDVSVDSSSTAWHSGRAQYDVWINFPASVESRGMFKYTRLTLGPKGGVIASDNRTLWGNIGIAGRYWIGRGRFAPAFEFSSALTFTLYQDRGEDGYGPQRSPVGFTADFGIGLGGFGALVVGGQFDSPMAREDIPERERIYASGMFFVGFRGNIVWGVPAAAVVATHALTERLVETP